MKKVMEINCSLGLVGGWANYRGVPSYEVSISEILDLRYKLKQS